MRIPISNSQKGCLKICKCSNKGIINECQPLPCISYDNCILSNKVIQHGEIYKKILIIFIAFQFLHSLFVSFSGSIFYMECNICSCFAGEIVCSKKQCDFINSGLMGNDASFLYTRLPCNCPPHHVPVCGSDGNTYPSSCLAK